MSNHFNVINSLRATGYRLTPQRIMVLNAIGESKGHVSAEEIFSRVREVYPYVDLATIYRTLQLLKRVHLVTEIDVGSGSAQFELTKKNQHHHMVCEGCGTTLDLDRKYLTPLKESLTRELGFEADLEHFALTGLCRDCSTRRARGETRGGE